VKFLWPGGGLVDARFGYLTAPNHLGIIAGIQAGYEWGGDLGCKEGPSFVKRIDYLKIQLWLETMDPYKNKCLFIAGGDIVGDAKETSLSFSEFSQKVPSWPLAFIAQDGQEYLDFPPTSLWCCLFVGGSTAWKLSVGAEKCIRRAQEIGKHIHIGRVNWWKRYQHFENMEGSNEFTCDGSRIRFGRDKALVDWLRYMEAPHQPRLFVPDSDCSG
jgi:hypothetical protein